jgi:23S rRNA pseudouridine1911/1915/1917 synthase
MDVKSAFTLHVSPLDEGKRLDLYISDHYHYLSRSFVVNLIKNNKICVDGQIKKPGYRIKAEDVIKGEIPPSEPCGFFAEPMDLSILHEDESLIVINKPPGLVVHPSPGHSSGTLVNGLLHHCPDLKGIGGEIRPGIVHRLDKDTSGVMVVAKDARTHQYLSRQFKDRKVKKEYIALVFGELTPDSGRITLPIGRHPLDRKKMSAASAKGREAETIWRITSRFNGFSLVKVNLKTGRTHQIRVHFSAIHHPVVGDPVYAGGKITKTISKGTREILKTAKRQMLHAFRITFIHPESEESVSFEAPVPPDMAGFINALNLNNNVDHEKKQYV